MDVYEEMMVGKTVDEVEGWVNGRSEEEGGVDMTTSATISLRDEHGDILTAIRRAWENAQTGEE